MCIVLITKWNWNFPIPKQKNKLPIHILHTYTPTFLIGYWGKILV